MKKINYLDRRKKFYKEKKIISDKHRHINMNDWMLCKKCSYVFMANHKLVNGIFIQIKN